MPAKLTKPREDISRKMRSSNIPNMRDIVNIRQSTSYENSLFLEL
jgi:hypothetical protein